MITVLLNPAAGTTHAGNLHAHVEQLFQAAGSPARVVSLGSGADAAEAARSAAEAGAEVVVAGGGDGTVNGVASALVDLAGRQPPLGVLPVGTLNHFAKDLGIPFDLARAVETIVAGHAMRIDVGDVNGRVFVNNSSIGIYPDIVVERERLRHQGYRKWIAFALASVRILRRYRGVIVRITAGDATKASRTPFLFVGNNEYQADGIHLGARARLDGGRLFAYVAPRLRPRDLPKLVALALVGRARSQHTLETFAAVALQVETPRRRRVRVAVDGEVARMSTPLRYRVRPLALRVIVPAR